MNEKTTKVLKIGIVVLFAGILDNILAQLFQEVLEVPLFMDMTVSMAVLFVYGLIPAILTRVVYTIISCIRHVIMYGQNNYVYIFIISAVAILFITWLFVRKKKNLKKGVNFTFIYILSACVCAALTSSVISGIISYFTYTLPPHYGAMDKIIYAFAGDQMSILATSIVGRIPITTLDRIITTFAGFGIARLYLYVEQKIKMGGRFIRAIRLNESKCNVSASIHPGIPSHSCFLFANLRRKIQRVQNSL